MSTSSNDDKRQARQKTRRRYQKGEPRRRELRVRISDQEHATFSAAADRAEMAMGAYVAEATLAAATGADPPQWSPLRESLIALMQAGSQVRKVGVNLNQAVAALHTTGQPTEALQGYAAVADRAVRRLDDVAEEVRRRLP